MEVQLHTVGATRFSRVPEGENHFVSVSVPCELKVCSSRTAFRKRHRHCPFPIDHHAIAVDRDIRPRIRPHFLTGWGPVGADRPQHDLIVDVCIRSKTRRRRRAAVSVYSYRMYAPDGNVTLRM
jgi:hypothetical protein